MQFALRKVNQHSVTLCGVFPRYEGGGFTPHRVVIRTQNKFLDFFMLIQK